MNRYSKYFLYILITISGLILSGQVVAQGINVEFATSKPREDAYVLDARVTFNFDDEVLNALEHGVSLAIDFYIRVEQERKWLWDKTVAEHVLGFDLQYHPLSNNYLVIDSETGEREQFQTLGEALVYLGSIKNYNLIKKDKLVDKKSYRGLIKAELNIESLPPPLQTAAYVSSQWQLESQWYEWVIR